MDVDEDTLLQIDRHLRTLRPDVEQWSVRLWTTEVGEDVIRVVAGKGPQVASAMLNHDTLMNQPSDAHDAAERLAHQINDQL